MIIVQFTGLSGAGKSTIANAVEKELNAKNYSVEVVDGDEYRKHLCKDLGFSEADRKENIRRLGAVSIKMAKEQKIVLLSAINPFEKGRTELKSGYKNVKTVWVNCKLEELFKRDTKGLYKRTLLAESDPNKVNNLTGINDVFEVPATADLVLETDKESVEESVGKVLDLILKSI